MDLSDGSVLSVTYQNEDTGFSVARVQFREQQVPVTCVGVMPSIAPGREIRVTGHWQSNSRYGRQFVVEQYAFSTPVSKEGIIAFLSSGALPTIGASRARQIYDAFGDEALTILEHSPERLLEIPRIGKKSVKSIREKWQQDEKLRKLLLFLQQFDVSYRMAVKIFKVYGEQAEEKISKNPYTLCEDIWGVGFFKADRLAQMLGFSHGSYKRIRAGIIHLMNEASMEGHTCLPVSEVNKRALELLDINDEQFVFSLDHALSIGMVIKNGERIYLPYLFYAEKTVAEKILEQKDSSRPGNRSNAQSNRTSSPVHPDELPMVISGNSGEKIPVETTLDAWINTYQQKHSWQADRVQRRAIKMIIGTHRVLLTGGPGTGKTTVIRVAVEYFREKNSRILLAAPTGRAAQRMSEVTGLTAQTIHRLLEYQPNTATGKNLFRRNEQNPLDADIVIVDEVSMMDIQLMSFLIKALRLSTHLVLVGDPDQLPSVGPGNVLGDFIASGAIEHIHLSTVFRQAASSRIITAAHEINSGEVPVFQNSKTDDCFFIETDDPEMTVTRLLDIVVRRLPASYGFDPIHDIQVLSPMHKGVLGTEQLNVRLQEQLRRSSKKLETGKHVFFVGDKVMQVRNNYETNVFNGDIGYIRDINEDSGLVVDFHGHGVVYTDRDLEELLPAFCISIHKSQGSEFKAVVLPLMTQHFIMLQRNLIYTALTRAKQICIIIGTRRALKIAVATNTVAVRYSALRERLSAGKTLLS